jgi:Cof subfamily protein (haloacid dehalogenase superfamily)
MIKLIVTDLDGTLLNDNHDVPERFWGIAERLFKKGIKLGIATGRPHFSITENFGSIMNHLYAISDNGSLIIHDKTELLSKPLPPHEIEALVIAARSVSNAWPILCGKDIWYLEDSDSMLIEKILIYHKNFKIVDDLTKVDDDILKMSVCDIMGAEQNSYPYFKQFENRLKIAVGGAIWLDITCTDANKGEAVQVLQQLNGIKPDETLVFGDFMNDYEMMKAATFSYAMKNAYPKIIEVANFVTEKDNNEDGILDVIEALCFDS